MPQSTQTLELLTGSTGLAPSGHATAADIDALPPHIVGEIVGGVLHTQARPASRHGLAAGRLFRDLGGPFEDGIDGPGGWVFLFEPELHLGDEIVVPDVAGWRVARLTPFPDTAFISIAPDWVAEVLSPSTQRFDRTKKLPVYATFGVGHCWLVDPIAKTLEVLELAANGKWQIASSHADASAVSAPPFEAKSIDLARLWL